MKEQFVQMRLKPETLRIIATANTIIENYQKQGFRMTARQLYYQFIAQDLFPSSWIDPVYNAKHGLPADTKNTEKNYKKLTSIVSDGRLIGEIDWDAIEDRGRIPSRPYFDESPEELLESLKGAAHGYRRNRWEGQNVYVELWVEKQALAGVLEPIASRQQITLMVNKGYSSQSAMYEASLRFREAMETEGVNEFFDPERHFCTREEFKGTEQRHFESNREGLLLYLGDHDPSGEDMVRDIRDRLTTFGVHEEMFRVVKVALTSEQILQYKPPPNPAKLSDPRAAKYIAEFGDRSWEVDALSPQVLTQLINDAVNRERDSERYNEVIKREEKERAQVVKALEKIKVMT